jgi:hypothetical protein
MGNAASREANYERLEKVIPNVKVGGFGSLHIGSEARD